jgi:hypothetical protein
LRHDKAGVSIAAFWPDHESRMKRIADRHWYVNCLAIVMSNALDPQHPLVRDSKILVGQLGDVFIDMAPSASK